MQAQISMGENFIIPLSGLANGQTDFSWKTGKEFFESFENTEVLDAELDVSVVAEKSGRYLGMDAAVTGRLVVECDRCLGDLEMPVDLIIRLSIKYGSEQPSDEHPEGEREVIFVPEDNAEFDMSQIIYDYVCLSLPMQRTHPEGECNPVAMKYYGHAQESEASVEDEESNPFAALKDMFK